MRFLSQSCSYPKSVLPRHFAPSRILNDRRSMIHFDAVQFLNGSTWPLDLHFIRLTRLTEADGNGQLGLGEIAARRHDLAAQCSIANAHLDPGADGIAITLTADELEANPMTMQRLIVAQEQRRPGHLRQHHIEIAVAVNIGKRRSSADDGLEEITAGLFWWNGDKARAAGVTRVPEQLRRLFVGLAFLDFGDLLLQMPVDAGHPDRSRRRTSQT